MLRGLLLLLICLSAVLPPCVCACSHHHAEPAAADQPGEPAGPDEDCPCQCHRPPTEATLPASPVVEGDTGVSFHSGLLADLAVPPPVPHPAFRSESPPGHRFQSLPLYLSVARLLI